MWQQHYSNNWLIKSGPSEKAMVGRLVYCFRHQHGCITKKQWSEPANSFRHGWFQESPATMTINNTQERADLNTNVAKTEWTREIHTNQSSSTECSRGIERGDLSQREGGMREVREGVQSCWVYILVWTIPPWPYQNDLCREGGEHHIITFFGN